MEKKAWAFEWCLVLIEKYTKSFGEKKSCFEQWTFSHQESIMFFCFTREAIQIYRKFFPSATLHKQK